MRWFLLMFLLVTLGFSCGGSAPNNTPPPQPPPTMPTVTPSPAATLTPIPTSLPTALPATPNTPTPPAMHTPTPRNTVTPTPTPMLTPTSDPTATPVPTPTPAVLGAVHVDNDGVNIGRCFGGDRCIEFSVACPNIPDVEATLRVTGTGTAGTVILTTGGKGTGLFGNVNPEIIDIHELFMDPLLDDGYLLVEVGWSVGVGVAGNGVWEGPGTTTSMACRSATAIDWVHNNLHGGGLFIAQGNSGGSAQIAFSLAYYGIDVLDLANLSGGPPPCPISTNGQINPAFPS